MAGKITAGDIEDFAQQLFPICRSITGNGVRETLGIIGTHINLEPHEIPTGTKVLDWEIPLEWNIRDAFIKDAEGNRIIDFKKSNLHVLNYSEPVNGRMSAMELGKHLFTLPDHPDWIPYKTSYYNRTWGFCLSENQKNALTDSEYEVCIDSDLSRGALTYGEFLVPGSTRSEFLISTHICHPSMANDNLSGILVTTLLAKLIKDLDLLYSYRFIFIPGTIGAITWLAGNEQDLGRISHGLVISGVGDKGNFTYKRSRRRTSEIDRIVEYIMQNEVKAARIEDFIPYGYDERQFCSPGFNLPVGRLSRTPYGTYPEYHTSADNLDFITTGSLIETLKVLLSVLFHVERNQTYINLHPKGEPQLGRRGIYSAMGGHGNRGEIEMAILWILNLSDGEHDLLNIADRSGIPFKIIAEAADLLVNKQLIKKI